jgi:hypothetical protein
MPFWHSALPLQSCAWPCEELPWVGHLVAHEVCALVVVAVPQQICPLGQSLFPAQLNAAVSSGHEAPCFTQVPVGLPLASTPTQHVSMSRLHMGVEPHGPMLGAEASSGSVAGTPVSGSDAAAPSGSDAPELEVDPELEPDPVLLELLDPMVELLEPDPEDDAPPPLLPVPSTGLPSPRSSVWPPLLPHPEDAKTTPAKKKRRSDPQALGR